MVLIGGGLVVIGVVSMIMVSASLTSPIPTEVSTNPPAEVNFPAPDIQLHDLAGSQVSLDDYRGVVILVNNWATWCPPCRQEMPILNTYYQDHDQEGFIIVAIDAGDSVDVVANFVDQYSLTFPVWLDPDSSALNSFRNNYLPSSYLIDRNGQVIKVWSGAVTYDSLDQHITPLLKD